MKSEWGNGERGLRIGERDEIGTSGITEAISEAKTSATDSRLGTN